MGLNGRILRIRFRLRLLRSIAVFSFTCLPMLGTVANAEDMLQEASSAGREPPVKISVLQPSHYDRHAPVYRSAKLFTRTREEYVGPMVTGTGGNSTPLVIRLKLCRTMNRFHGVLCC